ncbi:hypothetical protein PAHAL_4G352800 [Panicum hallii]|uniref:Thioredoxin domain-containing protein n=1 Tax=Panicum hallii TaxID=206008 RepID=A0A2T8JF49_9POAL|nr:hypothetical protein PAHAL_4G352800 [Panicum hallii]
MKRINLTNKDWLVCIMRSRRLTHSKKPCACSRGRSNRFVHTFCVAATAKLKQNEAGDRRSNIHPFFFPVATTVRVDLIKHEPIEVDTHSTASHELASSSSSAYMYARSSSHREASATEEAEAAQGCNMGLSLCSQQRSPPKQEIATREVTLPNTAASHQGRGEGNKQQMATTVPAIQSNEELKDVLRKAKEPNSKLVVLEFTAPWSEPCKFMRPALEKVASEFKDKADFYTLDVEQFKTFARNTRVEALPTFLLVRKTILERVISVSKDELQRSIAKHISRARIIAIDQEN